MLSKNKLFQYHYSILNKVTKNLSKELKLSKDTEDCCNAKEVSDLRKHLQVHCMKYSPRKNIYKLQSDLTPNRKAYSNCLACRGYVSIPNNKIKGNKSIDIGYNYSYVNLGLYDAEHPNAWSLPLDNIRIGLNDNPLSVSSAQLLGMMECADLPFQEAERVVNSADSGYSHPSYIHPLVSQCPNLNLVIRFRAGTKVYKKYSGKQIAAGRNKVYEDEPYYLQIERERKCYNPKTKKSFLKAQRPIFDLPMDEELSFETTTRSGRKLIIQLHRWNDLLITGSREYDMSNLFFDLVAVLCIDKETGEMVFKRPMFLTFWGCNKAQYTTRNIHEDYRHRYDIEVHNRFSKQSLLLDKYETPEVGHLDAWAWVVQLTYWLLYTASTEVEVHVNEWEKYLPEVKRAQKETAPKSVSMTRKGAEAFFSTFDIKPFAPKSSKNGKGRKKGEKPTPRTWKSPRKKYSKYKKQAEKDKNVVKLE
jgi:hypothetical protein